MEKRLEFIFMPSVKSVFRPTKSKMFKYEKSGNDAVK